MKLFGFILLFLFSQTAFGFSVELDLFTYTDGFSYSSTNNKSNTFYDLGIYMQLDKKGETNLGWNYSSQTISESGASTESYTLTEMGPKFSYYMDKEKIWGLFLSYNLTATASFNNGTAVQWRGTSYKLSFSFSPSLGDGGTYHIGGKINYAIANYAEQVSGTTLTTISYSRSLLYPSLHFIMHF